MRVRSTSRWNVVNNVKESSSRVMAVETVERSTELSEQVN